MKYVPSSALVSDAVKRPVMVKVSDNASMVHNASDFVPLTKNERKRDRHVKSRRSARRAIHRGDDWYADDLYL